jgi:hypothetical protein
MKWRGRRTCSRMTSLRILSKTFGSWSSFQPPGADLVAKRSHGEHGPLQAAEMEQGNYSRGGGGGRVVRTSPPLL